MFASGGKIGSMAAVAFALMCNSNVSAVIMINTVDNIATGNNVIEVSPGDSFTIDIVIEDDGIPASPFGDFYSASTSAQVSGVSQGVSFVNHSPGGFFFGTFDSDSDYVFFGNSLTPLMSVTPSVYLNDTVDVSDSTLSFSNVDISGDGTKLLARIEMQASNLAVRGETYEVLPFVFMTDLDSFDTIFPDSVTSATIRIIPEASSFIGWAFLGVTIGGVMWWTRSRAPAEVAKPDQVA